jgi:hypothetical protein
MNYETDISTESPNIKYITFYELNKNYIWGGIICMALMLFYYTWIFRIYFRVIAYKNNICAPLSPYQYDSTPCNNHIYKLYWKGKENFESKNEELLVDTQKTFNINGILAMLWDWITFLPRSIWKVAEKLQQTSRHINKEIEERMNPYYYRFTSKLKQDTKKL